MNEVHRGTTMQHGPITFIIKANKLIGLASCGFRSFAYIGENITDAKRSIVRDYNERKKI